MPSPPSISVHCGDLLFAGAQAKIFRFAGLSSLDGHPISLVGDGVSDDGGLCVKVMETSSASPHVCDEGQWVSTEELRATFAAAQLSTTLAHEGLIAYLIVDLNPEGTRLKMVMPLMAGDLLRWTAGRGRAVSEASMLHIAEQVASALEYLHSHGAWHLDVSLRNVLVDSLGDELPRCVVIDLETSTLAGRPAAASFTYEFAAPERATRPSDRCDVFSLGMLLFACGARHDCPGLVEDVPGLGCVTMNQSKLTPARIAAVVRRDLRHCESLVSLVTMMLNHDPATRPSMSYVLGNIRALRRSGGTAVLAFPYVCGPFDLVPLPEPARVAVHLHRRSNIYDLHAPCLRCHEVRSTSTQYRSDCGASQEMHLPAHTSAAFPWPRVFPVAAAPGAQGPDWPAPELELREAAAGRRLAPPRGIAACFLYPMDVAAGAAGPATFFSDGSAGTGGTDALQSNGGFALFPADDATSATPAGVRVLTPMASRPPGREPHHHPQRLYFTAAQPWPSLCTKVLSRDGRIHTQVPAMLGTAKCFAWILPEEAFTLANKELWVPAPDGGFVFWFGTDPLVPSELDRYFAVVPPVAGRGMLLDAAAIRTGAVKTAAAVRRTAVGVGAAIAYILGYLVDRARTPRNPSRSPAEAPPPPPPPSELHIYASIVPVAACGFIYDRSARAFLVTATGERGTCSEPWYVSVVRSSRQTAFFPPEARYLVFLRCEAADENAPPARRPEAAALVLPQHGFLLLNGHLDPVAVMPLRLTIGNAPPSLGAGWHHLPLETTPSVGAVYDGALPPARLYDPELPQLSPLLACGEAPSVWDDAAEGSVGYIGFSVRTSTFFLSDQNRRSWLVYRWLWGDV